MQPPTHQPLSISIITIVRNGADFIAETIESVISQTYQNIEYIVIDGLSTDGTQDIIRSYQAGITFWKSEEDEGIADAFNKGLAVSTGDYVLYLNADDRLAGPETVGSMVQAILDHESPPLIYGDIEFVERLSGTPIRRVSMDFSAKDLLKGRMFPHPGLFTHRRYFDRYGNFDTRFKITMDYEWLLRGAINETVVHVPILVSYFRDGGVSTVNDRYVKNETIRALKKNRFITSSFDEARLRGYFFLRTCAKTLLQVFGFNKYRSRG